MPREEQTLEEIYRELEFCDKPLGETSSTSNTTRQLITNDWRERISRIGKPRPCVVWTRTLGFQPIPGFTVASTNEHGKRGRGRPRKYPLPSVESIARPIENSIMESIQVPLAPILPNQLTNAVDYDADAQDLRWLALLDSCHANVKKKLTVKLFEQIIHELEHAWLRSSRPALVRNARVPDTPPHNQIDMRCEVCRLPDTDNPSNLLVLCDGCDLVVHQDCYGIPHIPEGPWLCRACSLSGPSVVGSASVHSVVSGCYTSESDTSSSSDKATHIQQCCLCPWPGGALKPTTDGRWCHVVCAQWVPGAVILNPSLLEPVDVTGVDSDRFKLKCYLCQESDAGAPIQCDHPKCSIAFHPYCAFASGLTMKPPQEPVIGSHALGGKRRLVQMLRVALCGKHGPVDLSNRVKRPMIVLPTCHPDEPTTCNNQDQVSDVDIESEYCFPLPPVPIPEEVKRARKSDALVQIYPLTMRRPIKEAPKAIVDGNCLDEIKQRLKVHRWILDKVYQYWQMKRQLKNGVLIRHLTIEPWTMRVTAHAFDQFSLILKDLMKIKEMCRTVHNVIEQELLVSETILEIVDLISHNNELTKKITVHSPPLDSYMDEYVWVDVGDCLIAGRVCDQNGGSSIKVSLYGSSGSSDTQKTTSTCTVTNKQIYILTDCIDADKDRLGKQVDPESHVLAIRHRHNGV
mgnify:CR=1 FL=1